LNWGFALAKQALYHLSHTSSPFCCGYFEDGVSGTILPRLASNSNPPISTYHVAKITGMSHWYLATGGILNMKIPQ
jgi:hypothetical protein